MESNAAISTGTVVLKGVSTADIKALEEQEAAELAEATAASAALKEEEAAKEKSALEAAQDMIKDLEEKLSAKEDELTKLNREFAEINNKQTIKEEPVHKTTGADVMKELFGKAQKEV